MPRPYSRPRPNYPRRDSAPPPAPPESASWPQPWVHMRHFSFHPNLFPRMVGAASPDAKAGDLVHVFDPDGQPFGHGYFNPRAKVPLRVLHHGTEPFGEDDLDSRLRAAVALRKDRLALGDSGDAFRLVHSDGDGLSGLVVDRYADTLSIEVTTLGAWLRLRRWLPLLHEGSDTRRHVIHVDPDLARVEGIRMVDVPEASEPGPNSVRITENGLRYAVNFEAGHKTGFFCDQRENRALLGRLARGRVLDLCTYTGGFALSARLSAGCEDVTGVDLDEAAIAQARTNANLNQTRVKWVHGDAFTWSRQMIANGEKWDTVVLDPPKLIHSRQNRDEGIFKYRDLNALAFQLVKPGGLLVTCSCSGLIDAAEFEELIIGSAHRQGHKLQILDRTGAGHDHPVMSNCPESRYLKVLWTIVQ